MQGDNIETYRYKPWNLLNIEYCLFQLKQVEEYMAYRKLPSNTRNRITEYFEHRYQVLQWIQGYTGETRYTEVYRGIQGYTGEYRGIQRDTGIQGYKGVYTGIQEILGIQGDTEGYRGYIGIGGIQGDIEDTGRYRWIQVDTVVYRGYRGIQGYTAGILRGIFIYK